MMEVAWAVKVDEVLRVIALGDGHVPVVLLAVI